MLKLNILFKFIFGFMLGLLIIDHCVGQTFTSNQYTTEEPQPVYFMIKVNDEIIPSYVRATRLKNGSVYLLYKPSEQPPNPETKYQFAACNYGGCSDYQDMILQEQAPGKPTIYYSELTRLTKETND